MENINKGVYYLFLSGICYALMSVLIRFLASEIPIFSQIFLRYIVAATIAVSFAKFTKTDLRMKNRADYLIMLFIAVLGYAFSSIFFTLAILKTTIASVTFIFSIYVVITPALGLIFLKEKISKFTLTAISLSLLGLYLLLNPNNLGTSLGGVCALISAFFQAIYLIGSRRLRNYSAKILLVYSTLIGVITLGVISLLFERSFYTLTLNPNIFSVSKFSWIVILLFGLDNFLAWIFLNKGLQTVKAGTSSVILLIEPVLASTLGIIFYKEIPQITSILGMIIISTGIILVAKEK